MLEDQNTEFKAEFADKLAESVAAFSSTSGGKFVLGIDDDGNEVGVFKGLMEEGEASAIGQGRSVRHRANRLVRLCIPGWFRIFAQTKDIMSRRNALVLSGAQRVARLCLADRYRGFFAYK